MYRIGLDVGGTNTDAVIMHESKVIDSCKTPTTTDIMTGVRNALNLVLEKSQVEQSKVEAVMIGTTHFTNAVVQRRGLSPTIAIRLCLPSTTSLVPMVDWPTDLRDVIGNQFKFAHGGYEFDGRKISNLDTDELKQIAEYISNNDIKSIAITSVFSPVNNEMEMEAKSILEQELGDVHFSLSSEIGIIGLLERENAVIMNACLFDLSDSTITAFKNALSEAGLSSKFYLTQNDGTLMNENIARKYPVMTFASGPTNSMRGAAFLSGLKDAVVIDIGGTTTDVGSIQKGFPRKAGLTVEVGGVRTNFRMPDIMSIGLGGGSLVSGGINNIEVGPQSVGYQLTKKSLIFGGSILTASDIAVAADMASFGDSSKVADQPEKFIQSTIKHIQSMLFDVIDRMRLSPDLLPVLAVGGASILAKDMIGDLSVKRPVNYSVANAVGAAIAQISGEIDRIYTLDNKNRKNVIEEAKAEAIDKALEAGALKGSVEVVDVEDIPLAYLPGNATRVRVKAVGDLDGITKIG